MFILPRYFFFLLFFFFFPFIQNFLPMPADGAWLPPELSTPPIPSSPAQLSTSPAVTPRAQGRDTGKDEALGVRVLCCSMRGEEGKSSWMQHFGRADPTSVIPVQPRWGTLGVPGELSSRQRATRRGSDLSWRSGCSHWRCHLLQGGRWKTARDCRDTDPQASRLLERAQGTSVMSTHTHGCLFPKLPWKEEYIRFTLAHLICI